MGTLRYPSHNQVSVQNLLLVMLMFSATLAPPKNTENKQLGKK